MILAASFLIYSSFSLLLVSSSSSSALVFVYSVNLLPTSIVLIAERFVDGDRERSVCLSDPPDRMSLFYVK